MYFGSSGTNSAIQTEFKNAIYSSLTHCIPGFASFVLPVYYLIRILRSTNLDAAHSQQIFPFQLRSRDLNYSQLMNNALYLKLPSGGIFAHSALN